MQNVQPSLFSRDHTFFGVCEGIGEDFGFNPLWLRAALPVPLFLYPVETLSGYFAAGALVLLSRLIVREPPVPLAETAVENVTTEPEPVPLAA